MHHNPDQFGWSDHAKRTQRERLGWRQPLYQVQRNPPWWQWAIMGVTLAALILVGWLVGGQV